MRVARPLASFFTSAASVLVVATMSGLALHAVMTEAAAHDAQVKTLNDRVVFLENELAGQAERIDALQAKHNKPARQARKGRPDPAKVYAVPVADSPQRGPDDAPITIVQLVDFQCPFCARAQPTLDRVVERYDGQVRVVFKHHPLPFHKRADAAALAAQCADEQGLFRELETVLWRSQRTLSDEDLRRYAASIEGMRPQRFNSCFEQQAPRAHVDRDVAMAKRFGASGTPAFFVNGRFLSGAQPFERFTALIDEELGRYRDSQIPAARFYDEHVMRVGLPRVD